MRGMRQNNVMDTSKNLLWIKAAELLEEAISRNLSVDTDWNAWHQKVEAVVDSSKELEMVWLDS